VGVFDRPLSDELTSAIHDVLAGASATDAWLEFVKRRHGVAQSVLARLALSEMPVELFDETDDVPSEEGVLEGGDPIHVLSDSFSLDAWEEIADARVVLERVEALVAAPGESDVVLLRRHETRYSHSA
jgi:hypothetical protein